MSEELEKIENVEEVETIPTDNTTDIQENVEQSTGEVSGEVIENEQAQKYNVH